MNRVNKERDAELIANYAGCWMIIIPKCEHASLYNCKIVTIGETPKEAIDLAELKGIENPEEYLMRIPKPSIFREMLPTVIYEITSPATLSMEILRDEIVKFFFRIQKRRCNKND